MLITTPLPFAFIIGATNCVRYNAAVTLTLKTLFHSSSETSFNGDMLKEPALLNNMSTVPYASIVLSTSIFASSTLEVSTITYIASKPSPLIWSTTSLALFSFLPVTTTFAPSRANNTAVALPIPEVDPVTMATLSFNFMWPPVFMRIFLNCTITAIHCQYLLIIVITFILY
ncbi:hypothetical protein SDC9_112469 [bioreactor metagenome]|uniref:Uncharacterized protein n=1 Tax=bioreactor metagenome TaxID=1076179 RepID=A0A645BK17_9ZZZZ